MYEHSGKSTRLMGILVSNALYVDRSIGSERTSIFGSVGANRTTTYLRTGLRQSKQSSISNPDAGLSSTRPTRT